MARQVLDEKGNFKEDNFAKLRSEAAPEAAEGDDAPSTSGRGGSENGGGRGGRGRGRGCDNLLRKTVPHTHKLGL